MNYSTHEQNKIKWKNTHVGSIILPRRNCRSVKRTANKPYGHVFTRFSNRSATVKANDE